MKKTSSQNLGPELLQIEELIKTARSFFMRREPRDFENVTLVPRWREHFRVFFGDVLIAELPPREVF